MNRRGFFTTLFAVPAATLVALKARAADPYATTLSNTTAWSDYSGSPLKDIEKAKAAFVQKTMGVSVQADQIPSGKDEVVIHLRVEGAEEATATLRELERRVQGLDRSLTRARSLITNQELRRVV